MTHKNNTTIHWDEHGQPMSPSFGDIYFSRDNGLEESRHVFLRHNNIIERFASPANNRFVIAETGFGTGLNFLLTWQAWAATYQNHETTLHFISVEKHPLTKTDLIKTLNLWPEIAPFAQKLAAAYPPHPAEGTHRLNFPEQRLSLTLYFGDALEGFNQCTNASETSSLCNTPWHVDAWFLDGFAPSKNPDMWSQELFESIAQLSKPNTTTFATFTVAGIVRRGMAEAGFACKKVTGFGQKREMLSGIFTTPKAKPLPNWLYQNSTHQPESIAIIGGGIAGCTAAYALARRGKKVTLFEKRPQLASESSGNLQGAVYTKLSPHKNALNQFNLAAQLFANRYYTTHNLFKTCGQQCGVLHLASDEKTISHYQQLNEHYSATEFAKWVNTEEASQLCGASTTSGGLYIAGAGWLHPAKVCNALTDHPLIEVRLNTEITHITANTQWHLFSGNQLHTTADNVIIANAQAGQKFEQTQHLPLKSIRGQVSHLPQHHHVPIKTVICGDGYLAPPHSGNQCLGATFNLNETTTAIRHQDHQQNIEKLNTMLNGIALPTTDDLGGRVGFRCTTPDYFPITGPVPQHAPFLAEFSLWRKKATTVINRTGLYHPGLYANVAFGSRGLAYAPLCAELLASLICSEPLPLDTNLYRHLTPARYLVRTLIRNK